MMASPTANITNKETVFFIHGMTCQSCVQHIESTLTKVAGVDLAKVSLELGFAFVRYYPSTTSPASLAAVVDDIGFESSLDDCETLRATWINVIGMTCESCVQHIEGMVRSFSGVRSVCVSLCDSRATIVYDSLQTSAPSLCGVIRDIGFDAELSLSVTDEDLMTGSECHAVMIELGDEFLALATTRTNAVQQQTCEISVEGMTCGSCVKNIESTVSSVAGVVSVLVSLEQKKATATFNPVETSAEAIAETIDDMGFEAAVLAELSQSDLDQKTVNPGGHDRVKLDDFKRSATGSDQITTALNVKGMHCQSCVQTIEGHLKTIAGVFSVKVTLADESCHVIHDPLCISAETVRQAVENSGDFRAFVSGMSYILFCDAYAVIWHVVYFCAF